MQNEKCQNCFCKILKCQNCTYLLNTCVFFKKMFSFNKLYPQSVLKHSVDHFQGIRMIFFFKKMHFFLPKYVQKTNFYPSIMSTISSKTFSGSFSRYWNENLFLKKNAFFLPKYVQKSSFYPSIYVHNQF